MTRPRLRDLVDLILANASIALLVILYKSWGGSLNPATISLSFLLVILIVATRARLWVSVVTAAVATGAFNFFFLPPIGTFTVADPTTGWRSWCSSWWPSSRAIFQRPRAGTR